MVGDWETTRLYPVFLDLNARLCVIVGGGADALRRARSWLASGADVAVISSDADERIAEMSAEGTITLESRDYVRGDLAGAFIVACLATDEETQRAVTEEAEHLGCLLSVPAAPELSNFLVPSTLARGPLQFAISTGGAAPAVAKRIKAQLAEEYDDAWATYMVLLGEMRRIIVARVTGVEKRRAMYEAMAASDLLDRVRAGDRLDPEHLYLEFFRAS